MAFFPLVGNSTINIGKGGWVQMMHDSWGGAHKGLSLIVDLTNLRSSGFFFETEEVQYIAYHDISWESQKV